MTASEEMTPALLSNRYKVISVLGDGGFGKTFLVEDTQMPSNRRCVLKQLKPVVDDPNLGEMVKTRFQREAAILEKVGDSHGQVPRLYAYFQEDDRFYLVEEWVDGETLTQRVMREGPLDEPTVRSIVLKLLPAVAHIHAAGIVHRDIKPDNIIVRSQDGLPVLIDFGAVKETMTTFINSQGNSSHSIVVGTPGYMPAEQLSGRPIFASDIYSIGMTAVYLLTGKIPQELDLDPHSGQLLWRQHAPGLTPEFGNFLDCAIHMVPAHRFASVQEMQSILSGLALKAAPASDPALGQPPSSQTVISAPPTSAPPSYASTYAAAPRGPASGPQSPQTGQTTVVSPSSQPLPAAAMMPSGPVARSAAPWRNAVITGGMIGLSILFASLVVIEKLPGADSGNRQEEAVASPETPSTPAATASPTPRATPSAAPLPTPEPVVPPAAPAAAAPNANASIVGEAGSKNIRGGAGTTFAVVDKVQVGDRVQVVDRNTDAGGHPWYRVITPAGSTGWIAGQLIQVDGDAAPPSQQPRQPAPPPAPVDRTNGTVVGEAGSKNIRSGPGTGYGTVSSISTGSRVVIEDSAQDSGGFTWYKVSVPGSGAQGWMAAHLVKAD